MKTFSQHLLCSGPALLVLFSVISISVSGSSEGAAASGTQNGYLTRTYTDARGVSMTYYLFVPRYYNPQKRYPLVLLLHGGGERAAAKNTPEQSRSLLLDQPYVQVWDSATVQDQWPSFIVVPQVAGTNRWVNVPAAQGSYQMAPQPTNSLRLAKAIVDSLQQEYRGIDPKRLYITGLSMGGYGVWDAIERWPSYFAAAAPVAGAGDPSRAATLTNLPIWDFHGTADTVVPVSGSRDMIQAIRAAGGNPLYTEYPQAGHAIWMQVYTSPAFLSWLFAQKAPAARLSSHPH